MASVNDLEITPVLENNIKSDQIFLLLEETLLTILKTGGINHRNIIDVFGKICKELEFNKKIKKEIISDTGSEKAILAIQIIRTTLNKYIERHGEKLDANEKKIIDFFLSEEGELILMAATSLIVKTFKYVSEAYEYADINNDGCVCGKVECCRFWKKIFCCYKKDK